MWHLDTPEWDKWIGRHGINVPFTYGGLWAGARPGETYSEADLERVRPFAKAMGLGYARYFDFQELESANKEIQEQTKRKSTFLASMSHELRTPMNAIKGFTNLVRRRRSENLTDRQRKNLSQVTQASDHLLAMINDLLDLSKIEAGRMDVNSELFDVKSLIQEQATHLVSTDEKTGIQAKERAHQTLPMKPGVIEYQEFEYKRHGTCCLIANFDVPTGQVIRPTLGKTRTEKDWKSH